MIYIKYYSKLIYSVILFLTKQSFSAILTVSKNTIEYAKSEYEIAKTMIIVEKGDKDAGS